MNYRFCLKISCIDNNFRFKCYECHNNSKIKSEFIDEVAIAFLYNSHNFEDLVHNVILLFRRIPNAKFSMTFDLSDNYRSKVLDKVILPTQFIYVNWNEEINA